MTETHEMIEWIPRGKNFESSECGKGRFDILFVAAKDHWLAIDWNRGEKTHSLSRAESREWCQCQLLRQKAG